MDALLNTAEPGNLVLLALCCGLLCVGGVFLMLGLQIIGGLLDVFTSIFELFFDVLSGGPVAWCGCLVLLGGCAGIVGLGIMLSQALATCGTPQAVNFCSFFGM
jgi:hypothetical protein